MTPDAVAPSAKAAVEAVSRAAVRTAHPGAWEGAGRVVERLGADPADGAKDRG